MTIDSYLIMNPTWLQNLAVPPLHRSEWRVHHNLSITIYIKLSFCLYIGPNRLKFGCTRFKQSYQRIHLQQNSCQSVCLSVCPRSFLSSGHKNGWRYSYEFLYLDQMSSNLKSELWIFWPQKRVSGRRRGGVNNGNGKITPILLTLRQILSDAKL